MGGDCSNMSRFFISCSDIVNNTIRITGEDVGHIKKVLRLKCGDNLIVCDGQGMDYNVRIDRIEENSVYALIIDSFKSFTEPPIGITLLQGMPKSDKMDYIIQKCVELGVNRIVPVLTERTVVKIDNNKDAQKKAERWNKISKEASKQCNRGIIPKVEIPVSFIESLDILKNSDLALIPYEKETINSLRYILSDRKNVNNICVMIGPEGGFTEKEVDLAVNVGATSVTLGPRILRTETAGLAVLSIIMYELGDVGK